ncbi:MAG TPA: dienelactone hydrolase family protein [Candidatus Binataceae bacterium]|nr:dienelactone hydrolase family protein [Candidatus Binataceae bacterium]
MAGKMVPITAADGGKFTGYLAIPPSGSGPGLVLLQEIFGVNFHIRAIAELYAEEGYVVLAPDIFWRIEPNIELRYTPEETQKARAYFQKFDADQAVKDITDTVKALRAMPECNGKVGALGFCLGGKLAYLAAARSGIDAAVSYYGVRIEANLEDAAKIECPIVLHLAAEDSYTPPPVREAIRKAFAGHDEAEIYVYPGADHAFNNDNRASYNPSAASLAHSRSLAVLHRALGPRYDLDALWEKHCEYEFVVRDVDQTMKTMVAEPYVNHVPTMTGGVGYKELYRFYKNHFIPSLPKDTKIVPISRTVGADRVIDEIMFCCTHDREIDFLLPGIAPTGKYLEIPTIAVVKFRGDKLCNEHIYWDQATALVQIGVLDPKGLPVAGIEASRKVVDEKLPSNTMMPTWVKSASKE